MAKLAVCSKKNHFQTVCTSKDKAKSRNASRLDENELYDDKPSDEDEKYTFSLSTKQSSKNNPFFLNESSRNTSWGHKVCVDAVLRFFWRGNFCVSLRDCSFSISGGFRLLSVW